MQQEPERNPCFVYHQSTSRSEERGIRGPDYLTIKDALGTKPSSFSVAPKSTESKTFLGKFCVKLCTSLPVSWLTAEATSKRVVSTGKVFVMLPPDVWKRRRASVYADAGFDVTGPEVAAGAATDCCAAGARPSRSAFSFAAFRRRSSLSSSILDLIRCLAAISSCFSLRFFSASLICSFFCRSSLIS